MFSPHYARARRRGPTDPLNHCSLNVVLYGPRKHWALTERSRREVDRDAQRFRIGPSALHWTGDTLHIDIDEVTTPWPRRVRGSVRVRPRAGAEGPFELDARGRHRWWPVGAVSDVEVDLERPALRWRGRGYLDWNGGDEPLATAFARWHWSRSHRGDGSALLFYDVDRRDGERLELGLAIDRDGARRIESPALHPLPTTRWWRVPRITRGDVIGDARVERTLEDTPFYARSEVSTRCFGEPVRAFHESLDLDRFEAAWVQRLLPFRNPRRP